MLLSWIADAIATGCRWHEESIRGRVDGDFEFLRRCADCDVGFVDEVEPALYHDFNINQKKGRRANLPLLHSLHQYPPWCQEVSLVPPALLAS